MIDLDSDPNVAIVLHPRPYAASERNAYDLEEAVGLTTALGVEIADATIVPLREVHASKYFGGGKIDEIKDTIKLKKANMVIVNSSLTPIQQRNLERAWDVKVIDRTGLILEIFGLRAATKEGAMQVEMARLGYERSRLVRTWTHLERQRGGQGAMSGPGETQIESDRRILNDKVTKLRRDLESVRRTRGLQRQQRQRAPERVVALVGYTNAGKSSLFNILTEGGVLAKDMLFATLDTTHRILPLPNGKPAVLSDTVGFIADLPTDLITAFRATLEEVAEADLLVHVRDISDPLSIARKQNVLDVLSQLEAGTENGQEMIEVWNKADLLDPDEFAKLQERAKASQESETAMSAYIISCQTGTGIEVLQNGIEGALTEKDDVVSVTIAPKDYKIRAWLHEKGHVLSEETLDNGYCEMDVQLSDADAGKLKGRYPQVFPAN
ncbi:MAG: GTPase HflX [Alphaproteobacteria bacterium]